MLSMSSRLYIYLKRKGTVIMFVQDDPGQIFRIWDLFYDLLFCHLHKSTSPTFPFTRYK